jgi:hypothetical protein
MVDCPPGNGGGNVVSSTTRANNHEQNETKIDRVGMRTRQHEFIFGL